ncbi:serine hydrolase [Agromyces sp. Marseille-Q5079]|uniref:serine hydrolase n=1 Tax=Agromyces sp. Marseille-Q5079 TaxID=3439059 RepID=UPI003D9CBC42
MIGVLASAVLLATTGCTMDAADSAEPLSTDRPGFGDPRVDAVGSVTEERVDEAVEALPELVETTMAKRGIPGLAVAVVSGDEVLYAEGFGERNVDTGDPVDTGTAFQIASMSKSVAATVVAHEVAAGTVRWDTPIVENLPDFALSDAWVGDHVTIGDLFAHRSGLWEHAGDDLEDIGYGRDEVIERLRLLPLTPFRTSYAYGNFDLTTAAESVARAAGTTWEDLSEEVLYAPLGMDATSSRFADFEANENHADGHIQEGDEWIVTPSQRDPDQQSPAGGVSSSIDDMAVWLELLIAASGPGADPDQEIEGVLTPAALAPALVPQGDSGLSRTAYQRSSFYGYGFNTSVGPGGLTSLGHSGAFALGTGTTFSVLPDAGLGIVVLTNASPTGIAETIAADFMDLAQFGEVRQDWWSLAQQQFPAGPEPFGELVGETPPSDPAPAKALADYAGVYANEYFGDATVSVVGDALELTVGPGTIVWPLEHWDGDVFVFEPVSENTEPGSVSQATFDGGTLVIESLDAHDLGSFTKVE